MSRRTPWAAFPLLLMVCDLALPTGPLAGAAEPPDANANAKARVEIARTAYYRLITNADYRLTAPAPEAPAAGGADKTSLEVVFDADLAERLHTWSCRWKDAQADAQAGPEGRLAALDAHLARMKALVDGSVRLPEDPAAKVGTADDPFGDLNHAIRDLAKLGAMTKEEKQGLNQSGDLEAFVAGVKFFHLEAQAWRAKAQAAK